jgi:DNA-binding transcriptional LysR family regulator
MVPVVSSQLFKEKSITDQEKLLDIDQIVVGPKIEKRGIGFGLLEGGKKWRVTDHNFKREIILAGLGWGHLPGHSIERELKEGKLIALKFTEIQSTVLPISLIRLEKNHFGVVARSLWTELASLHQR